MSSSDQLKAQLYRILDEAHVLDTVRSYLRLQLRLLLRKDALRPSEGPFRLDRPPLGREDREVLAFIVKWLRDRGMTATLEILELESHEDLSSLPDLPDLGRRDVLTPPADGAGYSIGGDDLDAAAGAYLPDQRAGEPGPSGQRESKSMSPSSLVGQSPDRPVFVPTQAPRAALPNLSPPDRPGITDSALKNSGSSMAPAVSVGYYSSENSSQNPGSAPRPEDVRGAPAAKGDMAPSRPSATAGGSRGAGGPLHDLDQDFADGFDAEFAEPVAGAAMEVLGEGDGAAAAPGAGAGMTAEPVRGSAPEGRGAAQGDGHADAHTDGATDEFPMDFDEDFDQPGEPGGLPGHTGAAEGAARSGPAGGDALDDLDDIDQLAAELDMEFNVDIAEKEDAPGKGGKAEKAGKEGGKGSRPDAKAATPPAPAGFAYPGLGPAQPASGAADGVYGAGEKASEAPGAVPGGAEGDGDADFDFDADLLDTLDSQAPRRAPAPPAPAARAGGAQAGAADDFGNLDDFGAFDQELSLGGTGGDTVRAKASAGAANDDSLGLGLLDDFDTGADLSVGNAVEIAGDGKWKTDMGALDSGKKKPDAFDLGAEGPGEAAHTLEDDLDRDIANFDFGDY